MSQTKKFCFVKFEVNRYPPLSVFEQQIEPDIRNKFFFGGRKCFLYRNIARNTVVKFLKGLWNFFCFFQNEKIVPLHLISNKIGAFFLKTGNLKTFFK